MSIREEAESLKPKLVEMRRHVHMNPELGFQEVKTSNFIEEKLTELGLTYNIYAKTGITSEIKGGKGPGKTLLLRADIDALPIQESNDVVYKSKNDGVFHACGHDIHISCLLGAAELLIRHQDEFSGSVLLVFQPAEEGPGGAVPMIEAGAIGKIDNPSIDAALALHVISGPEEENQVGTIGVHDGKFTGSSDEIYITVQGKGGHASAPHTAVDPVYIASQINVAIQGLLTRTVNPMEPVVCTISKIVAGSRHNIIGPICNMDGTLRTLNEEVRATIKQALPTLVKNIAQAYGGDADLKYIKGYAVGANDKLMNDIVRSTTSQLYGSDHIREVEAQLGSEDFFEFGFQNKIPIAMFWLGGSNPDEGKIHTNHSDFFDIDENCLPIGTAILTASTLQYLAT